MGKLVRLAVVGNQVGLSVGEKGSCGQENLDNEIHCTSDIRVYHNIKCNYLTKIRCGQWYGQLGWIGCGI